MNNRKPGRLAAEIKQNQPFRSPAQEATLGIFRTSDLLRRQITAVVSRRGVTLQQYNVLRILRGAGPEGLPTLEVGSRMLERTPGVTRMVDRLVRAGLVERISQEADRRVVLCRLTAQGQSVVDSLDDPVDEAHEEAFTVLDRGQIESLISILDQLRSGIDVAD